MKLKNIITMLILANSLIGHGLASDSDDDRGGGGGGRGGKSSSSEDERPASKPKTSYNYSSPSYTQHHSPYSAPSVPTISFTPPPSPMEPYTQSSHHRDTSDIGRAVLTAVVVESLVGDDDYLEQNERPNRTVRQSRSSKQAEEPRTTYQNESPFTSSYTQHYNTFRDRETTVCIEPNDPRYFPSERDCDCQYLSSNQCQRRTLLFAGATAFVGVFCLYIYYTYFYTWQ